MEPHVFSFMFPCMQRQIILQQNFINESSLKRKVAFLKFLVINHDYTSLDVNILYNKL